MISPGLYRHYKGNKYRVLMIAKHTETEEILVIYQDASDEKKMWARPLAMFEESVEIEGKVIPRFTRLED